MSGNLTAEHKEWLARVLKVAVAVVAGPQTGAAAAAGAGAAGQPRQTAAVATPFGEFVCFTGSKAQAAMEKIAEAYRAMKTQDETLQIKTSRLQELDEKYSEFDAQDLNDEIVGKTDDDMKMDAGNARTAKNVSGGFGVFLRQMVKHLQAARKNVAITTTDLDIKQTHMQAEAFERMGKEIQEGPGKTILGVITTITALASDAASLIEKPEDPTAWVGAANDLFDLIANQSNPFLEQAAELEEKAAAMELPNVVAKAQLAQATMRDAVEGIKEFEPIVRDAGRDLSTKLATRDKHWDAKKGGTLRMNEVQEGAELAGVVHDAAYEAGGLAEQVVQGIRKLLAQNGDDHAKWMKDPPTGNRIIASMRDDAADVSKNAIPLVGYSKKLQAAFNKLYGAAGTAMAEAPDR